MCPRAWNKTSTTLSDPVLKEELRRLRHRDAQKKYKQKLQLQQREIELAKERAVLQCEAAKQEIAKKDAIIEDMKAVMYVQKEELQALRHQLGLQHNTTGTERQESGSNYKESSYKSSTQCSRESSRASHVSFATSVDEHDTDMDKMKKSSFYTTEEYGNTGNLWGESSLLQNESNKRFFSSEPFVYSAEALKEEDDDDFIEMWNTKN